VSHQHAVESSAQGLLPTGQSAFWGCYQVVLGRQGGLGEELELGKWRKFVLE